MDHRIDIKRHDGKVDVVYQGQIAWSRDREWSGYEESRETQDALPTIAQWLLVRHHAVKTDTMTVYDDEAIYDNRMGVRITVNVGRAADRDHPWSPIYSEDPPDGAPPQ
jgi:hypothetical protein